MSRLKKVIRATGWAGLAVVTVGLLAVFNLGPLTTYAMTSELRTSRYAVRRMTSIASSHGMPGGLGTCRPSMTCTLRRRAIGYVRTHCRGEAMVLLSRGSRIAGQCSWRATTMRRVSGSRTRE